MCIIYCATLPFSDVIHIQLMCSINGTHGNQIFMNTKNIRPNSKSLTKIRTTEHVRTSFLSILALMSRAKVKKASSTLILFLALVSTNLIPCSTASCQTRNSDNGPIAHLVWSAPHSTSTIITHVIYIQLTLYIAIILIFFLLLLSNVMLYTEEPSLFDNNVKEVKI